MARSQTNKEITKIYTGSFVAFAGKASNSGIQYLLIMLLGRFLGPAEVGLFFLGRSILQFVGSITQLGFDGSLLKLIPECLEKGEDSDASYLTRLSLWITALFSTFLAIILYHASDAIAVNIFHEQRLAEILQVFSFCLPFFCSLMILLSLLRSLRRILIFSIIRDLVFPGTTVIVSIAFFLLYFRNIKTVIFAYFIGLIISLIISTVFAIRYGPKATDFETTRSTKDIVAFSLPFMGADIIGFLLMWIDTIMLGILSSAQSVGIYSGAVRIALFSKVFLMSVNAIFSPTISSLYTKGDISGIEFAYKTLSRWIIHLSAPFYLVIFVFSSEIMALYGDGFSEGSTALVILCIGQLVSISVGSAGNLLSMTGRPKTELMNRVLSLLFNFVLNLYLIPIFGINGAAIATSISLSLVNILRLIENFHYLGIHPFSYQMIWPFDRK